MMKFGELIETADNLQLYKYSVQQVANAYGLSATFMPKPIAGDNGSGMHVHQSLWNGGKPLFAGNSYADLSESALFYIGGSDFNQNRNFNGMVDGVRVYSDSLSLAEVKRNYNATKGSHRD